MTNKTYRSAKYTVAIEVTASANNVFDHVVNDVSKFWPEEFEGESAKLNDEFIFRSGDGHYSKNKVVELVPNKKLVWLVTESIRKTDNFEWTGTKMIFDLTDKGDCTLLEFTYDGFIPENEYDRLVQICNMVIKDRLYDLLINPPSKLN
jgi:methyltransferase-like protein